MGLASEPPLTLSTDFGKTDRAVQFLRVEGSLTTV
jgi:hypothetical protein